MANRSYLARLAQPLTAADPVVWSTPRAAADEARPLVNAPSRSLQRAPLAAPTTPVSGSVTADNAIAAAAAVVANRIPITTAAVVDGARSALPASIATARTQRRNEPKAALRPVETSPSLLPSQPDKPNGAPRTFKASGPIAEAVIGSTEMVHPVSRSESGAAPDKPSATPRRPADGTAPQTNIQSRGLDQEPRTPKRSSAPLVVKAEVPRLHIGAIEIRVSQPPAPVAPVPMAAAPTVRAPSAPLSRSYTSRFGLAQG